jgi:hypothetical protein
LCGLLSVGIGAGQRFVLNLFRRARAGKSQTFLNQLKQIRGLSYEKESQVFVEQKNMARQ